MAGLNRRFTLAATLVCLFYLTMSNTARAAGTVTNCTTFGPAAGTLEAALVGGGTITFACSGAIIVPEIDISSGTTGVDATGQSVTLSGNNANGVFFVASGATLNLTNLTIAHGLSTADGGGIYNNGTLTVTKCTFSGNLATTAVGDFGGGILNNGTLKVTNSTFSGNSAGAGGGIFNFGTVTVTNSTFSGNSGEIDGGGIANDFGTLMVTNCTFSGNSATAALGGGIYNQSTLKVTNSTFSGNSAGMGGGGIDNALGSTTLKGTILASEPTGGNCGGTITDAGFNISDDGSCGFSSTSVNGSTTLNLGTLANNGGPTETIALPQDSEAVDFIPIADCTDQSSPTPLPLTTDQRGSPRPDPGNPFFCDAGAYELQTSGSFILNSEKIQIARSTTSNADEVNMELTFSDTPSPTCDADDDVLRNGITVQLFGGSCSDLIGEGLILNLNPFVVHTIGGQSYGTIFQSSPTVLSPETVLARIVSLPKPDGDCGKWTLNVEVAGLNTSNLGLGGANPFALLLSDADLHDFCFPIDNAIVGNQIDPPHKVRRGLRR